MLQEKTDITALDTPLEWHCSELGALRDAMLQYLHVEVFRREVRLLTFLLLVYLFCRTSATVFILMK